MDGSAGSEVLVAWAAAKALRPSDSVLLLHCDAAAAREDSLFAETAVGHAAERLARFFGGGGAAAAGARGGAAAAAPAAAGAFAVWWVIPSAARKAAVCAALADALKARRRPQPFFSPLKLFLLLISWFLPAWRLLLSMVPSYCFFGESQRWECGMPALFFLPLLARRSH